jgi:hypothetical protein
MQGTILGTLPYIAGDVIVGRQTRNRISKLWTPPVILNWKGKP